MSTKLADLAKLAGEKKGEALFNLAHHMDVEFLREAYRRTRKDGATGVDEQSGGDYESNLEANLENLHQRLKEKRYRAPPVRRVYIPKDDGKERPLGIPTFEDKVVQRAVAMLLEPIYEQEFYSSSYGFRRGKSQHRALAEVENQCFTKNIHWIIDADIQGFFDSVDHHILQELVAKRVRDGSIKRLIGKWLNAGVWQEGRIEFPEEGTPQGGVISPLLANIYLHYVLDQWYYETVEPLLTGRAFLVRYADDFVLGFETERDARRVMSVLPKRFAKYKLKLNAEKTKLVRFRPPRRDEDKAPDNGSFTLLGFTHYRCKSRRTGRWFMRRRTASKRLSRALKRIRDWLRTERHAPVGRQHRALRQKLLGHYAYYGLPDNMRTLWSFLRQVQRCWYYWLNRRGAAKPLTWAAFNALLARLPLPTPSSRVATSYA